MKSKVLLIASLLISGPAWSADPIVDRVARILGAKVISDSSGEITELQLEKVNSCLSQYVFHFTLGKDKSAYVTENGKKIESVDGEGDLVVQLFAVVDLGAQVYQRAEADPNYDFSNEKIKVMLERLCNEKDLLEKLRGKFFPKGE